MFCSKLFCSSSQLCWQLNSVQLFSSFQEAEFNCCRLMMTVIDIDFRIIWKHRFNCECNNSLCLWHSFCSRLLLLLLRSTRAAWKQMVVISADEDDPSGPNGITGSPFPPLPCINHLDCENLLLLHHHILLGVDCFSMQGSSLLFQPAL